MNRFWRSRLFLAGLALFLIGTGPLLVVIALAELGLTEDPNPNPIGLGILAFLTFWPSIIMMLIGFARGMRRGK